METDTLVIGSGIAGAAAALVLSEDTQRQVTVLTRAAAPLESNSSHAQGGIVALGPEDSPEQLIEDILRAGDGLSYPPAVRLLAEQGPALVRSLLLEQAQVPFDRTQDGQLAYGLEAAHSQRRILHVGDATGRAIMVHLLNLLRQRPNVTLLTQHTAVDLITHPHHARDPLAVYRPPRCHGAYALDQRSGRVRRIVAAHTVLATGGLGQIYLHTTNPPGARGDGLAMAYRAGARVVNAEYIQFHPTALALPGVTKFLISEAVRGEGGVLLTPDGEPFMQRYAPQWRDLAPRDVVARAIYWEMIQHGYPYVLLDIASKRSATFIQERFPHIYTTCKAHGFDISREPIPVVPAAHYFCGGVLVDLDGRTTIEGLYAVGEVACTGVHGANRLASTSLLEGLTWGVRAAQHIRRQGNMAPLTEEAAPPWDDSGLIYDTDPTLVQGDMQIVRNLMWHHVGLVRSEYRLHRAVRDLTALSMTIEDFYRKSRLTDALIGLRNAVQAALLVARAARKNRSSRGAHYREDYPPDHSDTPLTNRTS